MISGSCFGAINSVMEPMTRGKYPFFCSKDRYQNVLKWSYLWIFLRFWHEYAFKVDVAYSSNIIPMIWATLGTISESRFGSTHTIFGTLNSWHPFLLCFSDDLGELFWYYSFCGGAHHSWYTFFAQMIVHRTCWNGVPWPAFRER